MLSKKVLLGGSLLVVLLIIVAITSCSDLSIPASENVVSAGQPTELDIPSEFQQFAEEADHYERMITMMDPYVIQTKRGEYVFDEAAFTASQASLSDTERMVCNQLKRGIAVVNEKIRSGEISQDNVALGIWANWHWWGVTWCYTGSWAYVALSAIQLGQAIPYVGLVVSSSLSGWAAYLLDHYGGFCTNQTWLGGVWLSAP